MANDSKDLDPALGGWDDATADEGTFQHNTRESVSNIDLGIDASSDDDITADVDDPLTGGASDDDGINLQHDLTSGAKDNSELEALKARIDSLTEANKVQDEWRSNLIKNALSARYEQLKARRSELYAEGNINDADEAWSQMEDIKTELKNMDKPKEDNKADPVVAPNPFAEKVNAFVSKNRDELDRVIGLIHRANFPDGKVDPQEQLIMKQTLAAVIAKGQDKGYSVNDVAYEYARRMDFAKKPKPQSKTKPASTATKSGTAAPAGQVGDKSTPEQLRAAFNGLDPTVKKMWKDGGFDRQYKNNGLTLADYIKDYAGVKI